MSTAGVDSCLGSFTATSFPLSWFASAAVDGIVGGTVDGAAVLVSGCDTLISVVCSETGDEGCAEDRSGVVSESTLEANVSGAGDDPAEVSVDSDSA